jgi:hypothetical protein
LVLNYVCGCFIFFDSPKLSFFHESFYHPSLLVADFSALCFGPHLLLQTPLLQFCTGLFLWCFFLLFCLGFMIASLLASTSCQFLHCLCLPSVSTPSFLPLLSSLLALQYDSTLCLLIVDCIVMQCNAIVLPLLLSIYTIIIPLINLDHPK